jgi:hypothetical protein
VNESVALPLHDALIDHWYLMECTPVLSVEVE